MKTYTAEQTAEILHVAPETIKRWARARKITAAKVGRQWLFEESSVQAFIRKRTRLQSGAIRAFARAVAGR